MGPFQLMDLIGIDVKPGRHAVDVRADLREARYRPHPIQVRMVAQKALGRKTGRGFYDYTGEQASSHHPEARQCNETVVLGAGAGAPGLGEIARKAGYKVKNMATRKQPVFLISPSLQLAGSKACTSSSLRLIF